MLTRPSATQTMSDANEGNAGGRPRDPRRGLVLMFLGLALFSILNAVVKAQAETFPVNQIVFFRNAGGAFALVIVLAWLGEAAADQASPTSAEPAADGGHDERHPADASRPFI